MAVLKQIASEATDEELWDFVDALEAEGFAAERYRHCGCGYLAIGNTTEEILDLGQHAIATHEDVRSWMEDWRSKNQ